MTNYSDALGQPEHASVPAMTGFDGGNVLAGLLPETLAASYDRLIRPFGFLILIVLMATGWLSRIIGPPYSMLMRWLQP